MTYRDLLLHVDDGQNVKERMAAAHQIAQRFDAHLSGLYVKQRRSVAMAVGVPNGAIAVPLDNEDSEESCEKVRMLFEESNYQWEQKVSWLTAEGLSVDAICDKASYFDLVILGQENDPQDESEKSSMVGAICLRSGRPVLLLPTPDSAAVSTLGENILIAWNGSREAVRGVHDALPFLEKANSVLIVTVDGSDRAVASCMEMASHLSRHGINIESKTVTANGIDVGSRLLLLASGHGSDLLVMGAYGHSRIREMMLGGVTRQILSKARLPVLFSH